MCFHSLKVENSWAWLGRQLCRLLLNIRTEPNKWPATTYPTDVDEV